MAARPKSVARTPRNRNDHQYVPYIRNMIFPLCLSSILSEFCKLICPEMFCRLVLQFLCLFRSRYEITRPFLSISLGLLMPFRVYLWPCYFLTTAYRFRLIAHILSSIFRGIYFASANLSCQCSMIKKDKHA
jgi:hypothetical protein